MFTVQYSGIAQKGAKFACCFTLLTDTEVQCVAAQVMSNHVFDTMQEAHEGGARAAKIANETGVFPDFSVKF